MTVVCDGEVEAVDMLVDGVSLLDEGILPVFVVVAHRERVEGKLESIHSHKELTILELGVSNLLLERLSPGRVFGSESAFVSELAMVVLPRVLHLKQSDQRAVSSSDTVESLDNHTVATQNALVVNETGAGENVLLLEVYGHETPDLVQSQSVGVEVLSRGSSQETEGLRLSTARNHLIVDIDLGIGFLQQREPPGSVFSGFGKGH